MIPSLRQQFNANFTPEKYQRLLQLMAERCGTPVHFRICETPCFFPKSLLDRIAQCGKELIHQLETPEYGQASSLQFPLNLTCLTRARIRCSSKSILALCVMRQASFSPSWSSCRASLRFTRINRFWRSHTRKSSGWTPICTI